MPRRPPMRRPAARPARRRPVGPRPRRWRSLAMAAAVALVAAGLAAWALVPADPGRLRRDAEAAAEAGDWEGAAGYWRALNRTPAASAGSLEAEAGALLQLGRAAEAERALVRASDQDPAEPGPWLMRLELLRLEDRPTEAIRVGWKAYDAVPAAARVTVLRALTLALLADVPDDAAQEALGRFAAADPGDLEARVALVERRAASGLDAGRPIAGAGGPEARIAALADLLAVDPEHLGARSALAEALADAGQFDRARSLLDAWPEAGRDDPRYQRLRGRFALDLDGAPAVAVGAFRRVLAVLPHDWRARTGSPAPSAPPATRPRPAPRPPSSSATARPSTPPASAPGSAPRWPRSTTRPPGSTWPSCAPRSASIGWPRPGGAGRGGMMAERGIRPPLPGGRGWKKLHPFTSTG